jgi:glutaminase
LQNYDGRTPLHLAAIKNNKDIVKYLLDQNVSVNPVDRWGSTPLDNAYKKEI